MTVVDADVTPPPASLLRAERRKLFSTQVWFWLLLASLALTAIAVVAQIAGSSDADLQRNVRDVLASAGSGYVAVFVLGVLGVTTEFRYQTITPTVLATPSRWRIITAKIVAYVLTGAGFAVAGIVLAVAMAAPWLSARGIDVGAGDYGHTLVAVFAEIVLYGLLGLGLGALLKNQIVAVSVGLLVILVVQNLVLAIPGVKYVYPYLPSGAAAAINANTPEDRVVNHVHLLPGWAGVVVLLVWGVGLAVLGAGITMRRDIT